MLYSLRMHAVNKQLQDLVYFPRVKTPFMQLTQRLHLQYSSRASSTFLPYEFCPKAAILPARLLADTAHTFSSDYHSLEG